MEILRGRAGVHHLQIVFGAQREEALDARAGMLGTLAFVAVRQQQHQAAGLAPFRFGAGDELIDQDLRAVDEIAELRLPQHQSQRIGHAVAEFKTHHRVLAERAVENIEARLVGRQVLQRNISFAGFAVVQFQVPLAESAAAAVLAAQPDRRSFQHQRAESQRFRRGPIDGRAAQDFLALLERTFQLGMHVEFVRET